MDDKKESYLIGTNIGLRLLFDLAYLFGKSLGSISFSHSHSYDGAGHEAGVVNLLQLQAPQEAVMHKTWSHQTALELESRWGKKLSQGVSPLPR